jgi:competence protein ComGC
MRRSQYVRRRPPARHAITLVEVLVIFVIIIVILGVLIPAIPTGRHRSHPQLKDSTQVRGITQALVVWASNNNGSYPLPSQLDRAGATIDEPDSTKDTTGNILSILIMNGNISPEIAISPAEANPAIRRYDAYEYEKPGAAAHPQNALWDPAFRGTPDDAPTYGNIAGAGIGHQSYAHAIPFGKREALWHDTYNSTEAIFGNRGPTYAGNDAAPAIAPGRKWQPTKDQHGTGSLTLLIHGGRTTWEGNIAYNDNHVNFETQPAPDQLTLKIQTPRGTETAPDNIFVNETNEHEGDGTSGRIDRGTNAYLRPIADVLERARPRVWKD